jgi:3-methyladenine DNA glycosylase AlkD
MQPILKELYSLKKKTIAEHSQRFFKTGVGEYGYGDVFLGIRVPVQRTIAKKYYREINYTELSELISSKYHEVRLTGLLVLVLKFEKTKILSEQKKIYQFYIKHFKNVNNWDLVDTTCHKIIGAYLVDKDRKILYKWAKSKSLWIRRISIISTFAFIRHNDLKDALKLSQILIKDKEDLMHKAVGWVLREVGKKDKKKLEQFIDQNIKIMPRTMLRYSIEKFPPAQRKKILCK